MAESVIEKAEAAAPAKLSRRSFLRRASLGAGAAALGLAGYTSLIEPNEIEVKRLELRIDRLSPAFDGFKIALISDLHFGPYTGASEIGSAVKAANMLQPDLVALLGDFVTEPLSGNRRRGADKAEPCAAVLSGLKSRFGSFAVLGNHDMSTDPERVTEALRSQGISLLRNSAHVLEQDGERLSLLGVGDVVAHSARLDLASAQADRDSARFLLVHEPDFADYASRFGIDAQFSGHSHGGQVRIPGLHPLWLPPLARKYYKGYYRVRGMHLYTNSGIGTVGVPFRFCSPPEVTLVTLHAGPKRAAASAIAGEQSLAV